MKAVKIITLTIFSIFATIYLAFLFVLPNAVDLNQYSPQITRIIQDKSGLLVNIKGLKVETAWNLSAGAKIDKTDLFYPDGEKFAQINGLHIKLSLIPLIAGSLRLDSISAEKVLANWDIKKSKKILSQTKNKPQEYKFSIHMPKISAQKYRISLLEGHKNYTLKGQNLDIRDFVLNKKIKVKTQGHIILNGNKQIAYNISIFSKNLASKSQKFDIMKVFDDFYKHKLHANIEADLKLDENKTHGTLGLNDVSFKIGEKVFPKSKINLLFKGEKAKINSTLYTDSTSKIIAYGWLKTGKNKSIDLQASTDKISIKNILMIAKTLSNTFKLKDLNQIDADGFLKANFRIKSDFKHVESNGYLKIKDAKMTNKQYKVTLSSINANVDFSKDAIKIRQATAKLNEQPITIKGIIDSRANANLNILANSLQLKGLLLTSGKTKLLKENDIAGLVNLNATLKGRLDKATPQISVLAHDIEIRNKKSNYKIKLPKAVITSIPKKKDCAIITLTGLKVKPNSPSIISAPKLLADYDGKNLNLTQTNLYFNNIKTTLTGQITDINQNPTLNNIKFSIPTQISVPILGYANSNIKLKGDLIASGSIDNPEIQGYFNIPSIRIPTLFTGIQNTTLKLNKNYATISCPQIQIANSFARLNATFDSDFSNGITVKNIDFASNNIDINTITKITRQLPKNGQGSFKIISGKSTIDRFRVGNIVTTGITSNVAMDKNILYAKDIRGDAYNGKIGGNMSFDFNRQKVNVDMQGRGLSANPALLALMNRNDDIQGIMDFDTDVSFYTTSIINSLKGNTNFIIKNGKMGILGKFEHLLYAQNVVSNNVFKGSLNLVAKAITTKNTGVYRYMKGKLTFSNGWANIQWIKSSGPSMSLYLTGRYYMPENLASVTILGRISDDVVRVMGPLGEFSMDKVISYIPKIGEVNSSLTSQITTNPNYENTSQIPPLSVQTEFKTKEFKVIIDGDVKKQSSVKTFKWLSTPKIVEGQIQPYTPPKQPQYEVPDFVKNLPDIKN